MSDTRVPPWTAFERCEVPSGYVAGTEPEAIFRNSRYQVSCWQGSCPLGPYVHLSIKDHAKSPTHDWRDLQRIKNELVGPEYEGIELYPAESRLVDTANQWHLYVFSRWVPPVGFNERLVADGACRYAEAAVQRPFESRPADCLDGAGLDAAYERARAASQMADYAAVDVAAPDVVDVLATALAYAVLNTLDTSDE